MAQQCGRGALIHKELVDVAVSQQEIDRNNKATTMLHYWNEFNTNYCEPLNSKMNQYEGYVNEGIKAWWESSSHEGIWVLYASVDKTPTLDGSFPAGEKLLWLQRMPKGSLFPRYGPIDALLHERNAFLPNF